MLFFYVIDLISPPEGRNNSGATERREHPPPGGGALTYLDQRYAECFRQFCQRRKRIVRESSCPSGNLCIVAPDRLRQIALCHTFLSQDRIDFIHDCTRPVDLQLDGRGDFRQLLTKEFISLHIPASMSLRNRVSNFCKSRAYP